MSTRHPHRATSSPTVPGAAVRSLRRDTSPAQPIVASRWCATGVAAPPRAWCVSASSRERIASPRGMKSQRRASAGRERIVREVITPPARVVVAPREQVVVAPRESGIVTTGYSTERGASSTSTASSAATDAIAPETATSGRTQGAAPAAPWPSGRNLARPGDVVLGSSVEAQHVQRNPFATACFVGVTAAVLMLALPVEAQVPATAPSPRLS